MLCIASMCSIDAFAEETSPISVSVKADKESYSKGDSLKFNVSVSNSGDSEIGDISLQASLPNKFKITSNEKYTVKLAANETKSYTVSAAPADAKGTNSPKTGVTPPIVIMLCFGAAVIAAVKTRKSKKVFSVIITAVLFSALAVPSFTAFTNAASKTEELTAKADFKYNNVSETITVKAKYELSVADIAVNTDNLEKKDNGSYKTADNFSGLSGKLNISDKIKTFTAETYDIHGEMTHSAAIEPKSDWKADELGLAEDYNKVVIRAEASDGKKYEESVVIFVPQVLDYSKQALRDVTGVSNARQLGGYINTEGRKIKQNVLLRTANLSHITDGGINALKNKYKVSDIIDLRYDRELNAHTTDKDIEGVNHHSVPMSATKDTAGQAFSQPPRAF